MDVEEQLKQDTVKHVEETYALKTENKLLSFSLCKPLGPLEKYISRPYYGVL